MLYEVITDYTVTMSNPVGGGVENIVMGNTQVTTTIHDETSPASEDTATVSISGTTTVVEGETATYTVSVNRIPTTDLHVNVTTGHITTENGDYVPVITTVIIPAGSTSVTFTVNTLDDALAEVTEDYRVSITGTSGGGFENTILGVSSVVTAITDEPTSGPEDTALVSITGDQTIIEGNTSTDYTVSVNQPASDVTSPITVTLNYGGVAVDGSDFTGVTTVTIPAGSNSATFTIDTIDDTLVEGDEVFTISIGTITDSNFENIAADSSASSVNTTIVDNDHAPVAIDSVAP